MFSQDLLYPCYGISAEAIDYVGDSAGTLA